ncbi:MAG: hypothetical protein AAFW70_10210 [Cyanobacteria bacterium J06635_10]
MKISQVIFGLIAFAVTLSGNQLVEAQSRPPGVFSLGEMGCREIEGNRYSSINKDIPIGFEIYRAVGVFGHDIGSYFRKDTSTRKTACRLASNGEKPKFKTLTLAVGFDDSNRFSKGSLARLSIYKDGKPKGYIDISKGKKSLVTIDVQNTRSIGLELKCLRGSSNRNYVCPAVYFFEDILE